jgi:hypothetical protein
MTGRNYPCPCGSGKKYKKCCIDRDEQKALEQLKQNEHISDHHSRNDADFNPDTMTNNIFISGLRMRSFLKLETNSPEESNGIGITLF